MLVIVLLAFLCGVVSAQNCPDPEAYVSCFRACAAQCQPPNTTPKLNTTCTVFDCTFQPQDTCNFQVHEAFSNGTRAIFKVPYQCAGTICLRFVFSIKHNNNSAQVNFIIYTSQALQCCDKVQGTLVTTAITPLVINQDFLWQTPTTMNAGDHLFVGMVSTADVGIDLKTFHISHGFCQSSLGPAP